MQSLDVVIPDRIVVMQKGRCSVEGVCNTPLQQADFSIRIVSTA